ncbi:MAG: hypothetical protein U0163_07825 [Gemmatimonadaceae bacterium]
MAEVRAKKTTAELTLIRKAAEISGRPSRGHAGAESSASSTSRAALEYTTTRRRAPRLRLDRRHGDQRDAAVLYEGYRIPFRPNDRGGDGCATEYHGYAADITRTIPVRAVRSPPSRSSSISWFRDAQAAAERNSKPGMNSLAAQDSSVAVAGAYGGAGAH